MEKFSVSALLGTSLGGFTLGHILSAIVIFLVCILVIKLLLKVLDRLMQNTKLESRITKYILTGAKVLLYVLAVIIAAGALGVNTTSLVALLSVCSLGITLAAEDVLSNVAGGLVILVAHPFRIGDFVEAAGVSGTVRDIRLNHTRLETPDGLLVMMPNKTLSSAQMTNYTTLGRRRVERKVTASYGASTEDVKKACMDAVMKMDLALTDPAPEVYLSDYGTSSVEYIVRCWCKTGDYWTVYFALGETLRETFAQNRVEMTYDHLNVHVVKD